MTAICRFLDADQQPQIALYDHTNQASPRVCRLDTLLKDQQLNLLANHDSIFQWTHPQLAELPTPSDEMWQPAPSVFLPPVQCPEKILCIGLNYLDHAIETGSEAPDQPVVFGKFNNALVGHGEPIDLPAISEKVDYEAELVVVIGKQARRVDKAKAMEHVFGYTAGHDVSARDWQKGRPGGQWLLGKSFDTFAPVGPAIVTADSFGDPSNVRVQMRVNDEVVQDSTTAQLIFDIPTLISHLSQFMTLQPGDLIFTGTPPGVGAAKSPPFFLSDGDRCSVHIEGVGELTNTCQST
ncbi:2-keto-4-pentenoate hydratase/2-oxohepta-3-ene-1,7-dioic acid hydratase (catechol pathway) [Neorhodopirellula lusitana]|uniref:2-keto-4-pentenoate hydratase/2-oxohepta-3-ene-1,7-dioic acid hydratase (Catechol pathway) n=1 Tax=Neorhodopirellula lusitana TaxID=445327 RepID=A0ABY1PWG6_9BACT|nr:fumarylacetoacetate hydrolase family protein [Neorhodopirellula lusitana]SMP49927.1 2-keto-4-pentenoate hydratase/2-oxohepta-3-ene-1,7-dioic acid hydratase (catechol pathway) [Neorhodopirellula lusitana]